MTSSNQPGGDKLLHLLVSGGFGAEAIREEIERGADVNRRDEIGSTPLHRAAVDSGEEVVALLLREGADVNAQDYEYGATPLHLACHRGDFSIVATLLANGANPNFVTDEGNVAAAYSAARGDDKMLALLIEHGFDSKAKLRHPMGIWAARSGQTTTVQLLLDAGCEINQGDNEGWTALHAACSDNMLDMVNFLLAKGADVHARCKPFNGTPLHYVCAQSDEYLVVAEILISYGADANARDIGGRTPYYHARDKGNVAICEMLVEHGAVASNLTLVAPSRLVTPA